MNNEYMNIDDDIIIWTNNGLKRIKHQNNIDEILKLENEIEILETNLVKEKKNQKKHLTFDACRKKLKKDTKLFAIMLVFIWVFPTILATLITGENITAIMRGRISLAHILNFYISPLLSTYVSIIFGHSIYSTIKEKRTSEGISLKINYLKELLTVKKAKLTKLKETKKDPKEHKEVKDSQNLRSYNKKFSLILRSRLLLMYKYVNHKNKLLNHYKSGELQQKLFQGELNIEEYNLLTNLLNQELKRTKKLL